MKNFSITPIFWVLILSTALTYGQIQLQGQDRFSIQLATDNVLLNSGTFYAGIEFSAEFSNGIYIRPQIHYAALTDGYLETAAAIGLNFNYNRWNYKSGIKLGVINRAATYPLFAVEAGIEYHITEKIAIGLRASYDRRGDADFYDGNDWVYNSQGFIKFVL